MADKPHGFSIVELLVVMTVLAVLATAAMPLLELTAKRNKERALHQALWDIRHAIDGYKDAYDTGRLPKAADASGYPPNLLVLVAGVGDSGPSPQKMYFLRQLPKNPFSAPDVKPEASWTTRSYASPPDKPTPGNDVFDVHALSDDIAINGSKYSEW